MPVVMLVGDCSIIGYPTELDGFRQELAYRLGPKFFWTGNQIDESGLRHEGHFSYGIDALGDLSSRIDCASHAYAAPHIVVLSVGMADMLDVHSGALSSDFVLQKLISLYEIAQSKTMVVFISTIILARNMESTTAEFNNRIRQTFGPRTVDVASVIDCEDLIDELHVSPCGYSKMAQLYEQTLNPQAHAQILRSSPLPRVNPFERMRTQQVLVGQTAEPAPAPLNSRPHIVNASQALNAAFPKLPESTKQIMLGIGWFESGFGTSGKFAPQGRFSYNWGALLAKAGQPSFISTRSTGTDSVNYNLYTSAFAGLQDFMGRWGASSKDTLSRAAEGDALGVAEAMFANGFFQQNSGYFQTLSGTLQSNLYDYAERIRDSASIVTEVMGESLQVQVLPEKTATPPSVIRLPAPADSGGGAGPFLALAAFAGLLWLGTRKPRAEPSP